MATETAGPASITAPPIAVSSERSPTTLCEEASVGRVARAHRDPAAEVAVAA